MGWIEISPKRFACAEDTGQSAYPLLDFIGPIDHEVTLADGSTEKQGVKCTRNAAASIALACAESPYEQEAQWPKIEHKCRFVSVYTEKMEA